jgi:uncharacterized phage protein (TIGR01671 family)
MRDIKFRGFYEDENGKDKAFINSEWVKGTWVYGGIFTNPREQVFIGDMLGASSVILSTIGQFTGLKDKNGVEIFEGDIIQYDCYDIGDNEWYQNKEEVKFTIDDLFLLNAEMHHYWSKNFEIIGNIHSNPELLKGQ